MLSSRVKQDGVFRLYLTRCLTIRRVAFRIGTPQFGLDASSVLAFLLKPPYAFIACYDDKGQSAHDPA